MYICTDIISVYKRTEYRVRPVRLTKVWIPEGLTQTNS